MNPTDFGWIVEDGTYYPVPMTNNAIPARMKDNFRCKCGGRCDTRRCPCKRSDPPTVCTSLCKCSDECENTDQDVITGIVSDTDEDDE